MNISQLLEDGINENNWELIAKAYTMITGNEIDVPENNNALSDILDRISKLEKRPKNSKGKPQKKTIVNNKFEVKSNKSSRNILDRDKKNKFEDMYDDVSAEAGQDQGFDKIDDNAPRSARNRKSYSEKSVSCSSCGKSYNVHPMFARENYICDKCIPRRGR